MENASKVLFKEIMVFVKEFESLGTKWCEENDLGSVARARSYGKKIISAMKPFIEESIKETDAAVAAEITNASAVVTPVVEPVVIPEETPVVAEVEAPQVTVEEIEEVKVPLEDIKVAEPTAQVEKKEVESKNKGFNFNKRK